MSQNAASTEALNWADQLGLIVPIRRDYLQSEIKLARTNLGRATRKVNALGKELDAAVIKYGKKSGHKSVQSPRSRLYYTGKDQSYWLKRVNQLEQLLPTVDDDQKLLVAAVEAYLQGDRRPKQCGAIKLRVHDSGALCVWFRKSGEAAHEGAYDGKFIIGSDGSMLHTHLR